jgi:nucleoside-diphosphate-sugar epimerase
MLKMGLVRFTIGKSTALVEFVHVDNLVLAHIQAARKIVSESSVVGGQCYFISDQDPINNFEFFMPLFELYQCRPVVAIPTWLALCLGWFVGANRPKENQTGSDVFFFSFLPNKK